MPECVVLAGLFDFLPEPVRGYAEGPIGVGVLILLGALVVYLLARAAGGTWLSLFGSGLPAAESGLKERLADYPAAGPAGPQRLYVEGTPVRVRLVVVCPAGKAQPVTHEEVEGLLDEVIRGLGAVVRHDKPRVRIWPPQPSKEGFAPTFHRYTEKPEAEGRPSRWVLAAGPASAGRRPVLLGLALQADVPNMQGRLTLDPMRWPEVVRVETVATPA
jgi:hypothetical protein